MGKRALGGCAAAPSAPAGPYLGAAEGAEEWGDLLDPADKQAQLSRGRRAMLYGTVTREWARLHHRLWYREQAGD